MPLGKLATERMVPLDDETVELVDRIVARAHPAARCGTRAPAGPRVPAHPPRPPRVALRAAWQLARAARNAGIGHVTPHQLRHTYATALINAGVACKR